MSRRPATGCLRHTALAIVATVMVGVLPATSAAQSTPGPRPRSFELSAAVIAIGPTDFGTSTARLVGNQTSGPEITLFNSSNDLGVGLGLDGRLAFNITRAFAIEGGVVWTRATLESRITGDVEDVPDVTLVQDVDTYFIDASAVWHLTGLSFAGGRGLPFVAGGAGYLRQLDDESLLTTDPGQVYHAGGGVKYLFTERPRGLIRGVGLRADARFYLRDGGTIELEDKSTRSTWGLSGGLLVRF